MKVITSMKVAVCAIASLFAIYVADQSYLIAHAGAMYQIPQLEGDGGGGIVVAALCAIGAGLVFIRLWAADAAFVLSALIALMVGLSFQDNVTAWWSVVPALLDCALVAVRYKISKRRYPIIRRPSFAQKNHTV